MGNESPLNIKITSRYEAVGVQKAIASMQESIGKAKANGEAFEELEEKVRRAQKALEEYAGSAERASDAMDPGAMSFQRGSPSGGGGGGEDDDGGGGMVFLNKIGGAAVGAAAGYATLKTAYKVAKEAVVEYAKAQETLGQLEASLRSRGQDTAAYKDHIVELAQSYEKLLAIDSEEWIQAASILTQGGAGSANMDKYMNSVKELAGLMGGDVSQAAEAMSKAINGSFDAFNRMGIKFEENWTQAQKLEHAMQELHKRGGGLLEERAKGLTGQFNDVGISASNLSENFGKAITSTGLFKNALYFVQTGLKNMNENLFGSEDATEAANSATKDYAKTADQTAKPVEKLAENSKEAAEDLQRIANAAKEAQEELDNLQKEESERQSHEQKLLNAQEKYDLARVKNARKSGVLSDDQAAQMEYIVRSQYARRGQAMEQAGYNREIGQNEAEIRRINDDLRVLARGLNKDQYSRVLDVASSRQHELSERNHQLRTRAGYSASEFGAEMQVSMAEAGQSGANAFGRVKNAVETYAAGMNGRLDQLGQLFMQLAAQQQQLESRTRHLRR